MRYPSTGRLVLLAAAAASALTVPARGASQEAVLTFGEEIRITGATVLRGGPASPPAVYPAEMEGNVIGMRGDTLLFETGNEPVYWIPLAVGVPVLERRAQVSDTGRFLFITGSVSAVAGATLGWGLHQDCVTSQALEDLGFTDRCPDRGTDGEAALRGALWGAGVGVVAGLVLGRFAKRLSWVPIPAQGLRYREGPTGSALSFTVPVGGKPAGR